MDKSKKYQLEEFLLDAGLRSLTRDGEPVHLAKLPFQILLYLIEHKDRVVLRDELLDKFWGSRLPLLS